jgi:hypothetical protein
VVDSATDASGASERNGVVLGEYQHELTQDLTVDLVSSPDKPEVVNESGDGKVNWSGNAITDVYIAHSRTDDTIEGNSFANDIDSRGGRDTVSTGAGDDEISVIDDVGNDVVDCGEDGPGITDNDTVNADSGDTLINCERVNP